MFPLLLYTFRFTTFQRFRLEVEKTHLQMKVKIRHARRLHQNWLRSHFATYFPTLEYRIIPSSH
jgi:hypothetical protein